MNCRTYEILERIHKNFDQIRSRAHSVLLQLTGQPELFLRKHENARIFRTAKKLHSLKLDYETFPPDSQRRAFLKLSNLVLSSSLAAMAKNKSVLAKMAMG